MIIFPYFLRVPASVRVGLYIPIATKFDEKQPRLLVCSVDVAAGETVTFDSYQKSDGSRKSEYGNYIAGKGYQNVIRYDAGITIDQVMASGAVPEICYYREIYKL